MCRTTISIVNANKQRGIAIQAIHEFYYTGDLHQNTGTGKALKLVKAHFVFVRCTNNKVVACCNLTDFWRITWSAPVSIVVLVRIGETNCSIRSKHSRPKVICHHINDRPFIEAFGLQPGKKMMSVRATYSKAKQKQNLPFQACCV